MPSSALSVFESTNMLMVPAVIALAFVLLFIGSLMVPGAKPEHVGKAVGCIALKAIGFFLIAGSVMNAVQYLFTVLSGEPSGISEAALLSLILVFVVGVGLMVHGSILLHRIDDASSVVARLVFTHTLEVIGLLIALVSALSIMLGFLSGEADGWEMQAIFLLLGLLLLYASSLHISGKNKRSLRKKR